MGMLFSKPKPAPAPDTSDISRSLAEREATDAASRSKELSAIASRRRTSRRGGYAGLLGSGGLLGVQDDNATPQGYIRDPMRGDRA